MAHHIFKSDPRLIGLVRSVSLCGTTYSSREAQAATEQQARAPRCLECRRLAKERKANGD